MTAALLIGTPILHRRDCAKPDREHSETNVVATYTATSCAVSRILQARRMDQRLLRART